MGSLRVGHDWATSLSLFTVMHWTRKWQPAPVFLPGESQRRGTWWASVYGVAQNQARLKWLSCSSSKPQKPKTNIPKVVNFWWLVLLFVQHSELGLLHKLELDCPLEACIVYISIIQVWPNQFLSSVHQRAFYHCLEKINEKSIRCLKWIF